MAIAAAVIGGVSLFGRRGSAFAALLGMLVLQSITSDLNLIGVAAEIRYIVTGAVLLLAVTIDSLSRRARKSALGPYASTMSMVAGRDRIVV